jgi:acetate CoA/acetoacetate CoA-transferase beta subunit
VTELAVIAFPEGRATLIETAEGVTVEDVRVATEAELVVPEPDASWRVRVTRRSIESSK